MRITSLHVYPVKSCRGINLDDAVIERRGFALDRRFMIVDVNGRFVSQRERPELATVRVEVDGGDLVLSHGKVGELFVDVAAAGDGPRSEVTVWRHTGPSIDQGDVAAEFIGEVLGAPSRLVYMPDDILRPVDPEYAASAQDIVGFADAYPLLITSTASLDALQVEMDEAVSMDRFRPNIVLDHDRSWDEDEWCTLQVGDVELVITKACTRCVITTTDQHTGERHREPLRTLARERRTERGVTFGVYAVPRKVGATIRVGDTVNARR